MKSIYLLGFRGAGKSTLLSQLGFPGAKMDLDKQIEKHLGEEIPTYIQREGISKFRELEYAILTEFEKSAIARSEAFLVATGGGIVDWAPSRNFLARSPAEKLYLRTSAELLWSRLKDTPERLVVGKIDSYPRFLALLEKRIPHFEKIATKTIDNSSMESTLIEIESWLFPVHGIMT